MSKQGEAIKLYFMMNNIKQKDAAKTLNLTSANLSILVNGKRPIGRDIAHRMHDAYGFNISFLLTGEGELLPSSRPINVNQENVSVGGDNIIASTTNNTTNQTTEGSDTSMLKKMCHDLLERVMELEQENCALRCKLNSPKHE